MGRGQPARVDCECERNGTANIFMPSAPPEGRRHVEVTNRRATADHAAIPKDLSDQHSSGAGGVILVRDNPGTQAAASLCAAFAPDKARRLAERFEWRLTPGHGSRLDMAGSELGGPSSQCLNRRTPDEEALIGEVAAWRARRNKRNTEARWHFTNDDARIKLRRLYPSL